MKHLLSGVVVLGLVFLTGCPNTSETGGTPGSTFKIKADSSVEVKKGTNKTVKVTVDRPDTYKQDIKLSAEVTPSGEGVTADLDPAKVSTGVKDANLTIKTTDKAKIQKYTVNLIGTPDKGDKVTLKMDVDVKEP